MIKSLTKVFKNHIISNKQFQEFEKDIEIQIPACRGSPARQVSD
jgi:hypothetical protein